MSSAQINRSDVCLLLARQKGNFLNWYCCNDISYCLFSETPLIPKVTESNEA